MRKRSVYCNCQLAIYLLGVGLFLGCTSQAQSDQRLLAFDPIPSLLDTIRHPALVTEQNGEWQWAKGADFLDSIEVVHFTYRSGGLRINGFLAQPKPLPATPLPCIIWNRGGNREFGAISLLQAAAMMGKLAHAGYIVIGSQYRGAAGSEGQDEFGGADLADVLNLIPLLNEIPGADTSRIGMFGGSRGGMMTYQALTHTDRLKTAVVLAGPSDMTATLEERPSMENVFFELVPNYEAQKEVELDRRSAIRWVDQFPKDVPIFIMHGNADWRVSSAQSLRLALALDEARVPYRLKIYEGADHGLSEHREAFYADLIAWFDLYLTRGGTLPNMEYHGR